jgi:hypothetical protein
MPQPSDAKRAGKTKTKTNFFNQKKTNMNTHTPFIELTIAIVTAIATFLLARKKKGQ